MCYLLYPVIAYHCAGFGVGSLCFVLNCLVERSTAADGVGGIGVVANFEGFQSKRGKGAL